MRIEVQKCAYDCTSCSIDCLPASKQECRQGRASYSFTNLLVAAQSKHKASLFASRPFEFWCSCDLLHARELWGHRCAPDSPLLAQVPGELVIQVPCTLLYSVCGVPCTPLFCLWCTLHRPVLLAVHPPRQCMHCLVFGLFFFKKIL